MQMIDHLKTIREALAEAHDESLDGREFSCRQIIMQQIAALAELERTHYTPEDVADASAKGFRDGVASVTAGQGQEPVAWMYDWLPAGGPTAYDWISGSKAEVFAPENCYFNIRPLFAAAPVAQRHVPEADCGNIDWKAQYEHQKRRAERWIAKYEADIGPLETAGPVAQQPRLQVGDSQFESWYNEGFDPKNKGLKQHMREAYEAGMNDPATQQPQAETDESIAADAYGMACDEMERWQHERRKAGKEVGTTGSLCDGIAWLYQYVDALEAKQAQPTDLQLAKPEPLTSYVQPVPDHCDRIVWRNRYYHLPLKQAEAVPQDLLKDAQRYQWLRTHQLYAKVFLLPCASAKSLDDAVDFEMAKIAATNKQRNSRDT